MLKQSLVVQYITVNNCFVKLPDKWLRKVGKKESVVEISHENVSHFVSCSPKPSPDLTLKISATFARSLNIKENDQVFVTSLSNVPSLTSVNVRPRSVHDLDILALQREKVQSTLLSQVRVVAKDRPIVVWVSKFSYVTLIAETLEPNFSYGKLEELTTINVSDVLPEEENAEKTGGNESTSSTQGELSNDDSVSSEVEDLLKAFRNRTTPYVFRVCNLPKISCPFERNSRFDEIMCAPFHGFVLKQHLPQGINLTDEFVHCKIRKISEPRQNMDIASTSFLKSEECPVPKPPSELTIALFLMDFVRERCSEGVKEAFKKIVVPTYFKDAFSAPEEIDWLSRGMHRVIYLSDTVMTNLNLKVGSKVILQLSNHSQEALVTAIEFYPHGSVTGLDLKSYVTKFSKFGPLVLNSCCTIVEGSKSLFTLKLIPEVCSWGNFYKNYSEVMGVIEKPKMEYFLINNTPMRFINKSRPVGIKSQTFVYAKCEDALKICLGLEGPLPFDTLRENILICGEAGSGKTTVCNMLMESLETGPYFVHMNFIDCKALKGKKVDILQKILTNAVVECVHYQPSLLFLENLECITYVSSDDEEITPDSINVARTTDMIVNVVKRYQEEHFFSVIATCVSATKLGRKLRPAKGCDFFRTVLTIKNPDQHDRRKLLINELAYAMNPTDLTNVITVYDTKTEGWMPQDIIDASRKAYFIAQRRYATTQQDRASFVKEEDVVSAFKNYTPISLRDLPLHKDSTYTWSDIGGLNDVKQCLIAMIQWPLMYPDVYKRSPIKLQSGVLLYGMPGTGKTMIAKAIANECRANLISIKGPELLSKYIGISEESVRNVFERARRAKPCVLFFDEFESLAPRRGHDSTGVTDRVVNQLLTQLDGVEDRQGVAVVAASSRPDLLDPALLRPGRLDKLLLCRPPDEEDRFEILKSICKAQRIRVKDSDLRDIAQLAQDFTGADLNALMTQARLIAVEEALAASSDKLRYYDVRVINAHLVEALRATYPSLSPSEKAKYSKIYEEFSAKGTSVNQILIDQKVTLA